MLPYTPLHYLLFSDSPEMESEWAALVMTSGNLSEEPIVVSNQEAMLQLGGVADWFLLHNRDIFTRVDDSVTRTFEGRERVLRRSRGFVPQSIDLGIDMEEVLAFGGELKNTFCLTKGRYAILSQHIGDLENYETMRFFEETLDRMKHIFRVVPRAAAYDLHPGYMSTRMAAASGIHAASACNITMRISPAAWRRTICAAVFSAWPWMAPDLGQTARYGEANFWLRILPDSPGEPICGMSCFPAATRRCGSRGVWRSATCEMPSGGRYPLTCSAFRV